jgi:two-component system CheB/CheR fusion protein
MPRTLRHRVEQLLARHRAERPPHTDLDPSRLVHELEVRQIELETQNDELHVARRDIEAALQRSTQLFEFAPIGYFVLSVDGIIAEVNLAGARSVGAQRTKLAGRDMAWFVADADRRAFARFLSRVIQSRGEATECCELALVAHGGCERHARITGTMLVEAGAVPRLLVALEDITERKRAESALRAESRHKDEFLAALSHELRNPLAPIRNGLHLLDRAPAGSETARKARAVIDRQLGHLTRLVDDLLDATRIARGKIELRRQRIELGELVRQTIEDHRSAFERNGVELLARVGRPALWVDGDPTRLVQALGNLLANAAKFTDRGGKVEVDARGEEGCAVLSVRDSGIGIAPEVRQHLFVPFRQGPQNVDRSHGGLGLGLATAKGLVELHGGTVQVASPGLGEGSTFTIRLPLSAAPSDVAPRSESDVWPYGARRCRVLIIEDNVDAADTLRDALQIAGHEVRTAYDGPSGLARATEFRPEIVLCDIGLPGIDGYEVARRIRGERALAQTCLVALSGYALPDDVRRTTEAGFQRHLIKPPDLNQLGRLIQEASAPDGSRVGCDTRP